MEREAEAPSEEEEVTVESLTEAPAFLASDPLQNQDLLHYPSLFLFVSLVELLLAAV